MLQVKAPMSNIVRCVVLFLIVLMVTEVELSMACEDIDGLYDKRGSLSYTDEDNVIRAEIDAGYRTIIFSLYNEYERGESSIYDQCGEYYKKDEILFPVIVLMKYYRDCDVKAFIESLAHDKEGLNGMWSLEEIVHFSDGMSLPKKLGDAHLPYTIIHEIRLLASQGNKDALDFLFSLNGDGGYGTNLDMGICVFMCSYPEVVVSNWETVKKYRYRMQMVIDVGCNTKTEPLINTYIKICDEYNVDSESRQEILSLFERLKHDR